MAFRILLALALCIGYGRGESCPMKSTNELLGTRGSDAKESEFLCDFIWTDSEHLKEKLLNRISKRQKSFIRFTVPVLGYNNQHVPFKNYTGYLTWVWVLESHEYMLYYPHNFIVTSAKTMGIVTQDWALDYNHKQPISLEDIGVDPDWFDTDDVVGHCETQCIKTRASCGIGKYELERFLLDFTDSNSQLKWNWICLELPYDVQDIVTVPQFAFPDFLYYWRFLKMFFSRRSILNFGMMKSKSDFPHYYCYDRKSNCEMKELLSHYWVIPTIGILLFLYSPLLVYYFPSSGPKKHKESPLGMFPSYKTPIYFGRCLKSMLCFYKQEGAPYTKIFVFLRRLIFLLFFVVLPSFRLLDQPPYSYYAWPVLLCSFVAVLVPSYCSKHIDVDVSTNFLIWKLPPGLTRESKNLKEYQQLAHVMQERIYLTVDARFWKFLFSCSFSPLHYLLSSLHSFLLVAVFFIPLTLFCCLLFLVICVLNFFFYFNPLLYFYFTLLRSIWVGELEYVKSKQNRWSVMKFVFACCHGAVMVFVVTSSIVIMYFWCFAVSEFTMFTFIGGILTASMAFQYFVLVGSLVAAIYALIRDLHKEYDCILEEVIEILQNKETFEKLSSKVQSRRKEILLEVKEPCSDSDYSVTVRNKAEALHYCELISRDGITTYVNKDMFDDTCERCLPLRRQIFFIVVKVVAIVFYGVIAFWVKNVYHLEDKVNVIFNMVQTVAIYFLPNMIQFVSYKSHFGKKTSIVLRQEVYNSLVLYISNLNQST